MRASDEFRRSPVLWLLVFVPVLFVARALVPESRTALFALSILAIVPLAALLSRATESVAAKTGDTIGGLLNATLGNLTELVITLAALRAGMFDLVKATIAGAVITNSLFLVGGSFLLGGLKYHIQEFNQGIARLQSGMLFIASVALLVPSGLAKVAGQEVTARVSAGLAVLLIVTYGLGLLFSLRTHREFFKSAPHDDSGEEAPWPIGIAAATLGGVTVVVAVTSEIFVDSVQEAALTLGMTPAFVGFVVVALVGAAAEMTAAFAASRRNRLDLSIGIGLGAAAQIALFVAPVLVLLSYLIAPSPLDLAFWPGAVVMVVISMLTVVLVTSVGRSVWYMGVMVLMVYLIFALTLYMMPPRTS